MEWATTLDAYEKLILRMNTPRVVVDNAVLPNATLVQVVSARQQEILLDAVQILTDLNLCIKKAYMSSDGRWFMDVFHVTDQNGNKIADQSVINSIEQSLSSFNVPKSAPSKGLTTLELTGRDRQGLLSEVFAVLSDLQCVVVEAKAWTHDGRVASLIYLQDEFSGSAIEDPQKISCVERRLRNVLGCESSIKRGRSTVSAAATHSERRLHQMMFADLACERTAGEVSDGSVCVHNWSEKGYSVVNVRCRDRPKLLFDVVCTLTDMQYVIFHGTVYTEGDQAYQEFYVRQENGSPITSEAERQHVTRCLQASIERRASEGVRVELCTADRPGLLAQVTRTLRENGLSISRAEVLTAGDAADYVFYVSDAAGFPPDSKTIDALRERVAPNILRVEEPQSIFHHEKSPSTRDLILVSLGSLVRRNLYNLGLIKSCS